MSVSTRRRSRSLVPSSSRGRVWPSRSLSRSRKTTACHSMQTPSLSYAPTGHARASDELLRRGRATTGAACVRVSKRRGVAADEFERADERTRDRHGSTARFDDL